MNVNVDNLHKRIAEALGWSEHSVRSLSLMSLRELVRPISGKLAHEITQMLNHVRAVGPN